MDVKCRHVLTVWNQDGFTTELNYEEYSEQSKNGEINKFYFHSEVVSNINFISNIRMFWLTQNKHKLSQF